jgi:hypothetical protein
MSNMLKLHLIPAPAAPTHSATMMASNLLIMPMPLVLGGAPVGFHVLLVLDHHFLFLVDFGFYICSLRRIITKHFDV